MSCSYRWGAEALGLVATLSVAWQDGAIHGLDCRQVCDWDGQGNELPPRMPSAAEVEAICRAFLQTFDTGWWDTRETIERRCEVVM